MEIYQFHEPRAILAYDERAAYQALLQLRDLQESSDTAQITVAMRELVQVHKYKKLPAELRTVMLHFLGHRAHLYGRNAMATSADAAAVSAMVNLIPWQGKQHFWV